MNTVAIATTWTPRRLAGIFTHFKSGQRVILDPRDPFIAVHFLETGEWEEHLEPVWQEYLQPAGSIFVDVGANIGIHSIRATKYGAIIHAFEPDPDTFALLSLNLSLNGSRTRVVRNVAISASAGTLEFAVSNTSAGLSGAVEARDNNPSSWCQTLSVDAVALDEVVMPSPSSALLKIDVEGHEAAVLQGAEKFIQGCPHLGIVIEYQRQKSLVEYFKNNPWYQTMFDPTIYRWMQPVTPLKWEHLDEWDSGDLVLRKYLL